MTLRDYKPGDGWSLFLDRDGVINRRIPGDYVRSPEEFNFLPGVPEAFPLFMGMFDKILVVTNQQGIGKGCMTETELMLIHDKLHHEVTSAGGRIDRIYFCPDLAGTGSFCRKPNIGMALKARKDFPEIQFKKSLMAGDSLSDMQFGHRCGMTTVLISADPALARQHPAVIDLAFPDLLAFAQFLLTKTQ